MIPTHEEILQRIHQTAVLFWKAQIISGLRLDSKTIKGNI